MDVKTYSVTARRVCCYKNCTTVQTSDRPCSETLFKFPKDERRYQLWMELGRVEESPNIKGSKYFCSKHFDAKKYISSNPRRKLLLTTAIPYEYKSDNEGDLDVGDDDLEREQESYYVDLDERDMGSHEENCHFVESTISDDIFQKDSSPEREVENRSYESPMLENSKKMKLCVESSSQSMASSFKTLPTVEVMIKNEKTVFEAANEGSDIEYTDDDIFVNPDITKFIFKGEEYVQMPKSVYKDEKVELLKELRYYKDIVLKIKKQLSDVKT